ncbi:MAG TPA: HNH endonuclease domain-containing protein, partial [Cytophagaceae bacterium]|nr:HNH endonuclease domain-containing protein [Cytophagaceae bacterium]
LESTKIFDTIKQREIITGKKRCPVSRPEFEEFRALSFINNIEYRIKGDKDSKWQQLPQKLRTELYSEKFLVQKDFEFITIYKWIKSKNGHDNWELNYNYKTNVSACVVSSRLRRIFGEEWNKRVIRKDKNNKEYSIPFYEDLWHVLFESDDEDFIEEYGRAKLGLSEDNIEKFCSLWYSMPTGYSQLSLKAINNIRPFLQEGFIYTDAVLLGKVPEILGNEIWNNKGRFITESLKEDVIENNRNEKRTINIVNNLIAQYKSLPKSYRFADNDFDYIVGSRDNKFPAESIERDHVQIYKACEEGLGKETWVKYSVDERNIFIQRVIIKYQEFFNKYSREFYTLPRVSDAMKNFILDNFEDEFNNEDRDKFLKRLASIYHPSMIDIYPKAREEFYKHGNIEKQSIMLGSPKTGAFKNPMAMRALHELRKLMNYFIATGQIDEETRIIVEVARELNDTNKRWAYEKYQEIRRDENKEFSIAIRELLNDPEAQDSLANAESDTDISKFRLWYEMIESMDGFEKSGKFISTETDKSPIEKKQKLKKTKRESAETEDGFYEFTENKFENIKKEVWVKLKKGKDNIEEKYQLWKQQQYCCIYTGKPIKITDLFNENLIDIEHTIPRSVSFDNSLANKTVCYADFNRNIKKNRIPYELDNYDQIKQRIEKWQNKVRDLEMRVEFWKGKSKQASTPEYKNSAIRQKHLWQFELDYWKNKVQRFTINEVKAGFKNSQLKDTQLISKYAFHYLKSYFNRVDVQKGEVTAQFRKIFNLQETGTEKDRSKHSHHAKDAIVLSMIPSFALRDRILEIWYKIQENKQLLKSDTENDKRSVEAVIRGLEEELQQLKNQCSLPKGINDIINKLDEEIIINSIARNRSLIPASKKVRFNGKTFVAKGDALRGQIHKDSFLGAIRLVKKDENGKWLKTEDGKFELGPIKYVIREELVYKKNSLSPGFKSLDDLENQIVDKDLFNNIIKPQVKAAGNDFKEALNKGIWMLDKKGNK